MSTITSDLAALLSGVERPGDFSLSLEPKRFFLRAWRWMAWVRLPCRYCKFRPKPSSLWRSAHHTAAARKRCSTRRCAAHGRSRRRGFTLAAATGQQSLNAMAAKAAEGLGVAGAVQAEFYKLLVYGEGDFFVSHRDTEKSAGMFATLVIVLPSNYAGGELVVRHYGREIRLDMRREDPSEAAFAAFYADCLHEVLPITSGCRLTLIYNLLRKAGSLPEPPDYRTEQDRVSRIIAAVGGCEPDTPEGGFPEKIVYPLQHAYTPAELSFEALKGADAAVAAVLKGAAPTRRLANCISRSFRSRKAVQQNTRATIDRAGAAGGRKTRTRFRSNRSQQTAAPCLAIGCGPMAHRPRLRPSPSRKRNSARRKPSTIWNRTRSTSRKRPGTRGASFERTYRRAALTLWPSARTLTALNRGGLKLTLPYLAGLAARWEAAGAEAGTALWRETDEL